MSGKLELAYNDGTVLVYKNGAFIGEWFCEYSIPTDLEDFLEEELTRYNVGAYDA